MKRLLAAVVATLAFGIPMFAFAAAPQYDVSGNWVFAFNYGGVYPHDVSLSQDSSGSLTGSGGYPVGGPYSYTWVVTSGSVSGNTINLTAAYTGGPDAVTPLTTMHIQGTIATNGTMSGTWDDNYQGGARNGTWSSTSGTASAIMVKIQIFKYIDGVLATAATANNAAFPMLTTFTSPNLGNYVDAPFTLSPSPWGGIGIPYEADFIGSVAGATYTAHEVTSGNEVVGASCADGKPFALVGYSVGDNTAAAEAAPKTITAPTFTDLQSDHVMIVWNTTCAPVVLAKNQCMNDGWQSLVDSNHRSFKNQGDCVSFVATKGKNKAAGN